MPYKIQPWAHQLKAIEAAKPVDEYALFFEQGTGKTKTLCHIIEDKIKSHDAPHATLILCPQIVIENWKRELVQHTNLQECQIITLRDSEKKRCEHLVGACTARGIMDLVVVTNYEGMLMKGLTQLLHDRFKPDAIVLDESHKCKDMTAKRTKAVLKLGASARYRYILSGTPVVNSVFDIFSQFLFLDNGATFGKKFFDFRRTYFYDKNAHMPRHCYFPDWQIRAGALDEINKLIYKKAMRVKKADCLDLPPFVRQIVDVEMTASQKKLYNDMERDSVAELNGGLVSADMAIKKALRLQQIVTGHITDDDKMLVRLEHNRIKALEEVISTLPKDAQFIVWAVFKHNYEEIRNLFTKLEITYGEIHGEVSAKAQQQAVDGFDRGHFRALLCHPASGGTGINLTAASYAIFYSRGFSLEADLQSEARNYRGGSERHSSITRIDLCTPGTTDDLILTALKNKQDVSEQILKYLRTKK